METHMVGDDMTIAAPAMQAQIISLWFDPLVIGSETTEPVLLQAEVSGNPTRVVFELNTNPFPFQQPGTELQMRDDGTGGDPRARDGIYSVMLQAEQLVQGLQPDDVFRRFVGFLKLFQGEASTFWGNVFAEVITDEIPRLEVRSVSQDIQYTESLVNIFKPGFFSSAPFEFTGVSNKFYQFFPDEYDFLNIIITPAHFQNRFHSTVKNDVQGIGLDLFDGTSRFGSSENLRGFNVFPNTTFFDGAELGYQHELAHQWINFLEVPPLDSGIPHWPLSSLASGIMGWSDPVRRQGLQFPCQLIAEPDGVRLAPRPGAPLFTDLDLYLMGLLPPERVGEHLVFADQEEAAMLFSQQGCQGRFSLDQFVLVDVQDIVSAVGPRVPDSSTAPKQFRIATIIVSEDELLSESAMSFYSFFVRRAEETDEVRFHTGLSKGLAKPFAVSTGGLGTIDTRVRPKR